MPTHLTRPLLGCRLRDCGAPDCPTCAGAEAARIYREQQECDHEEHDHGICLACGADITDRAALVLQQIDAALALAAEATPGPWEYDERPGQQTVMALDGKATVALGFHLTASNATMPFIATSRTLLPASLRGLKTAIEGLLPACGYWVKCAEALTAICDTWEAAQ